MKPGSDDGIRSVIMVVLVVTCDVGGGEGNGVDVGGDGVFGDDGGDQITDD